MRNKQHKITDPFYNTMAWRKLRDVKINDTPLCESCSKRALTVLATEVDHIVSIKLDYTLRLTYDNLQSLCRQCHAKKTFAVDKRVENGLEPIAWEATANDGMPTDKAHPWYKED